MSTVGRWLVVGWLLAALVVLGMDGRLPEFACGVGAGSVLVVGIVAVVRQQLAPSPCNRPSLPERYIVADDLGFTLAEVVAVAEAEAERP